MTHVARLLIAALAVACVTTRTDRPAAEPIPLADQLRELNAHCRRLYGSAKPEVLERSLPLIVDGGDELVLHRRGRLPETVAIRRTAHDSLKSIGHVSLAVFGLLAFHTDRPLDDAARREIDEFRRRLEAVQAALAAAPADAFGGELERQRRIVAAALQFLNDVARAGTASADDLRRYARGTGPDLLANVDRAAADQLDRVHEQVSRWRKEMPAEEWAAVRVAVIGTQPARAENLATQYYLKLLKQPEVGDRVVYAEQIFRGETPQEKALELVKTRLLDRMAAEAFFGDPQRLFRDLLADGARKHLATMTLE
jgi:hypothetical protein